MSYVISVSGVLSDMYGRVAASSAFLVWTVVMGLLASMAGSPQAFEALWCLLAFGMMGSYVTTYVRYIESEFFILKNYIISSEA